MTSHIIVDILPNQIPYCKMIRGLPCSLVQEAECVVVAEILELDERVLAVTAYDCLHELVDEVIVFLAGDALVSTANVEVVFQQLLQK